MKDFIIKKEDVGMSVYDFFKKQELDFVPIAFSINNRLVTHDTLVELNDLVVSYSMTHKIGYNVYKESLGFLLTYVVKSLLPAGNFELSHTISKSTYGCFRDGLLITSDDAVRIKSKMKEIIKSDLPFKVKHMTRDEALKVFENYSNFNEKHQYGDKFPEEIPMYSIGDDESFMDNYYGPLVPSAKYLEMFDVQHFMPGVLLRLAKRNNPNKLFLFEEQPKIFDMIEETNRIVNILELSYITSLNRQIIEGRGKEMILIGEALQEQKIAQIAKHISNNSYKYQLIMISGPSSSGKTTFSKKMKVSLMAHGHKPILMSLDDFYLNRDSTPLDEDGKPDFENIHSIDIELFQDTLTKLINGEEVETPVFNFKTGMREHTGNKIKKDKESPIIIEGIHGMNPILTSKVPRHMKYIVYVTALTPLNLDPSNHIKTADGRIIRRMVRDNRFRSLDTEKTFSIWPSVRKGEENNIFKYQELADIHFNSSLPHELNVLKVYAEPLLKTVTADSIYYIEAQHLLNILRFCEPLDAMWVPSNSILREFIGQGIMGGLDV
ncbi:MAG: uridine kinase [Fusobacteria bacterium]|nr:MAG: uridine kinase [Fusobacteriota bacterium]KAF0228085.1 MAG: uridine [Fusobacteriota bacterium]